MGIGPWAMGSGLKIIMIMNHTYLAHSSWLIAHSSKCPKPIRVLKNMAFPVYNPCLV